MHASHHIDQSGNIHCRACVFVHMHISAMLASAMLAICVWTYTASLLYAFMHQLPHRRWRPWWLSRNGVIGTVNICVSLAPSDIHKLKIQLAQAMAVRD